MQSALRVWLYLVALAHLLAGLAVALLGVGDSYLEYFISTLAAGTPQFDMAAGAASDGMTGYAANEIFRLFGITIAAWGLLFGLLVRVLEFTNWSWVRHGLAATVVFWFGLDTLLSITHGLWIHLVFNVPVIAGICLPLYLWRPEQRSPQVATA